MEACVSNVLFYQEGGYDRIWIWDFIGIFMKGNQRLPSLSLSSFNLGSLAGVTLLIGVSKGIASLIPGPITISLSGRVFGKLRSLRGWHFLCGQRFMGRSLHWTILCLGAHFGESVLYVPSEWRTCGSSPPSLSCSSLSVGLYALDLWDSMGHARLCGKLGVLLELLAGKI